MQPTQSEGMGRYRAIMTDTDREYITGGDDVDSHKRYQAISRVRNRINEELSTDVELLEEHHPGLLEELREIVCVDVDDEDIAESGSSKDAAEPVVESDQTDIEAKEDVYDDLGERVEPGEETQAAEDVLRDLDLPGSGSKYETRVNAVATFYEYLRDHRGERVSKGDLKELAENTGLDVGYSSFDSLWNNWVKSNASQGRDFNTLSQLPGVEMDGDDYVYIGETDE